LREEKATEEEMKRLRIILLLFSLTLAANSQTTLSVIFQPTDLGFGVRVDQQVKDIGFYASGSKGEYRFDNGYIKDHYKITLGGIGYMYNNSFLTVGINHHIYGKHEGELPKGTLDKYSLEIGAGARIKRVAVFFAFDPIKGEGNVGIGFVIR